MSTHHTHIPVDVQKQIDSHPVVLYMKGTPEFPLCPYASTVVSILHQLQVEFKAYDVADNVELKEAVKKFSGEQTTPQLYIRGTHIGGSDKVVPLFDSGELQKLLADLWTKESTLVE